MNLNQINELLDRIGEWTIVESANENGKYYQLLHDYEYVAMEWGEIAGLDLSAILPTIVRLEKTWSYIDGATKVQKEIKEALGL